jgi:hypothetical protein
MTSEEEEDDSEDDDVGSRYDTVTFLAHIPDVRSLPGVVSGGSTSQASRAALVPVEGEKERVEGRTREGPSDRWSTEPGVAPTMSAAQRPRAKSPLTSSPGGAVASTPKAGAPSSGVRTQGQMALVTQRALETSSA